MLEDVAKRNSLVTSFFENIRIENSQLHQEHGKLRHGYEAKLHGYSIPLTCYGSPLGQTSTITDLGRSWTILATVLVLYYIEFPCGSMSIYRAIHLH